MKYFCIINKADEVSNEIAERISNALIDYNFRYDEKHPELIIVVGGDGKFLRSVHEHIENIENINYVVINTGTLGFASDFESDEVDVLIKSIIEGNYKVESCNLIKTEVIDEKGDLHIEYALNEFRVENPMRTLVVDVYVDNDFFEEFSGNGLCISTQFGSSAYNRSLMGAIVAPNVEIMQITEIAGIHNNKYSSLYNSLIVSKDSIIKIIPKETENVILGIDYLCLEFKNFRQINISLSDKKVNFVRYRKYSFYERLHQSFIV